MRFVAAAALLAWVSLAGSGCVTKIYQGPTTGRAGEPQIALAKSADRALEQFDAKVVAGKRVLIQVFGLTERLEGESPEEAYIHALLNEQVLRAGGQLAGEVKDAQVLLTCALRSAGVDVARRDVPLIYVHHQFRAVTSARILAATLQDRIATTVLHQQSVVGEATYTERYILYIFGPIQSRD